jgi:hypothetical protein
MSDWIIKLYVFARFIYSKYYNKCCFYRTNPLFLLGFFQRHAVSTYVITYLLIELVMLNVKYQSTKLI